MLMTQNWQDYNYNQVKMNIGKLLGSALKYPLIRRHNNTLKLNFDSTVVNMGPHLASSKGGAMEIRYSASTRKARVKPQKTAPNHQPSKGEVKNLNEVMEIIAEHIREGNHDKASKISLGLSNQLYLKGAISKQQYLAELWQTVGFSFQSKSLDLAQSIIINDLLKQTEQELKKSNICMQELYSMMAIMRKQKKDYKSSIKWHEKAMQTEKVKQNILTYMFILSEIILLQKKQGRYKQAVEKCQQYWKLFDAHKHEDKKETPLILSLFDVIKAEYQHGNTAKAVSYLAQANQMSQKMEDPQKIYETLDILIQTNQLIGFDVENEKVFARYMSLCQNQFEHAIKYLELALKQINLKWKRSQQQEMLTLINNLEKFMSDRKIYKKNILAIIQFYKGLAFFGQLKFDQSMPYFKKAIQILNTIPIKNERVLLLQLINVGYVSLNAYLKKDSNFKETVDNFIKFVENNKLIFVNLENIRFLMSKEDKDQFYEQSLFKTLDLMIKTHVHSRSMQTHIQQMFKAMMPRSIKK